MNKRLQALFAFFLMAAGALFFSSRAAAASVSVQFTNISAGEVLVLDVGQSVTFDVQVDADEDFVSALMLSDEFYPGRGVYLNGADIATQTSSATLHLTATGKNSTADLPGGLAPVALVVGVRYPGGVVYAERVDFYIQVP